MCVSQLTVCFTLPTPSALRCSCLTPTAVSGLRPSCTVSIAVSLPNLSHIQISLLHSHFQSCLAFSDVSLLSSLSCLTAPHVHCCLTSPAVSPHKGSDNTYVHTLIAHVLLLSPSQCALPETVCVWNIN